MSTLKSPAALSCRVCSTQFPLPDDEHVQGSSKMLNSVALASRAKLLVEAAKGLTVFDDDPLFRFLREHVEHGVDPILGGQRDAPNSDLTGWTVRHTSNYAPTAGDMARQLENEDVKLWREYFRAALSGIQHGANNNHSVESAEIIADLALEADRQKFPRKDP